jgi:hypothetical protein
LNFFYSEKTKKNSQKIPNFSFFVMGQNTLSNTKSLKTELKPFLLQHSGLLLNYHPPTFPNLALTIKCLCSGCHHEQGHKAALPNNFPVPFQSKKSTYNWFVDLHRYLLTYLLTYMWKPVGHNRQCDCSFFT